MASGDRTYTPERAAHVCRELAGGRSLRDVCANDPGMPAEATVRLWAVDDVHGFAAQYARAREAQAELYADQIIEIADEPLPQIVTTRTDGTTETRLDPAMVGHKRNQIDARKWIAARLRPKVYGDRVAVKADVQSNLAERLEAARKRIIGRE